MAKVTAAAAVRTYNSAAAEPFANGSTASYVEEMYNAWLRDPTSVHTVSFPVKQGFVFKKESISNSDSDSSYSEFPKEGIYSVACVYF